MLICSRARLNGFPTRSGRSCVTSFCCFGRQRVEPQEGQPLQHDRRALGHLERDVDVPRRAADDRVHRRRRKSAPAVQHLDAQHVPLQLPLVHVLRRPEPDPLHRPAPRQPARVRRRDRRRQRGIIDRLVPLEVELAHRPLTVLRQRARTATSQRHNHQRSREESGPRELHALRLAGGELMICKEIRHSRVACAGSSDPRSEPQRRLTRLANPCIFAALGRSVNVLTGSRTPPCPARPSGAPRSHLPGDATFVALGAADRARGLRSEGTRPHARVLLHLRPALARSGLLHRRPDRRSRRAPVRQPHPVRCRRPARARPREVLGSRPRRVALHFPPPHRRDDSTTAGPSAPPMSRPPVSAPSRPGRSAGAPGPYTPSRARGPSTRARHAGVERARRRRRFHPRHHPRGAAQHLPQARRDAGHRHRAHANGRRLRPVPHRQRARGASSSGRTTTTSCSRGTPTTGDGARSPTACRIRIIPEPLTQAAEYERGGLSVVEIPFGETRRWEERHGAELKRRPTHSRPLHRDQHHRAAR